MNLVKWKWWLCKTNDFSQIAVLNNLHEKKLQTMLNHSGSFNSWLHIEDPKSVYILEHQTCLLGYRNNELKWSAPIFNCEENTETLKISIIAMGWFQLLNKREIHTGYEWKEMAIKASGRIINRFPIYEHEKELEEIENQYNEVISSGFYTPIATETAEELVYRNTPTSIIAMDLLNRANIDHPTTITPGLLAPTNSVNLTLHRFQNVGEEITKLTAIESSFDFDIDPLTRKFNTYRNVIRAGIAGKGQDRGSGVRFTYPGNSLGIIRLAEGMKTQNRTEAIGQYSVGKSESIQSIQENGLFEGSVQAPEVVNLNILNALSTIETSTLEKPFTIISINPRAVSDSASTAVPRPLVDYEDGDIVYVCAKKGPRLSIGFPNPQPVRIFGMTINMEDDGSEKVNGIQTVYSQ